MESKAHKVMYENENNSFVSKSLDCFIKIPLSLLQPFCFSLSEAVGINVSSKLGSFDSLDIASVVSFVSSSRK